MREIRFFVIDPPREVDFPHSVFFTGYVTDIQMSGTPESFYHDDNQEVGVIEVTLKGCSVFIGNSRNSHDLTTLQIHFENEAQMPDDIRIGDKVSCTQILDEKGNLEYYFTMD